MSTPAPPRADAVKVYVDYLLSVLDSGVHVGQEWPAHLAENLPVVAISRGGGGTRLKHVTDSPRLDIDVLASSPGEAWDLAAAVAQHIEATEGTTQGGVRIYEATVLSISALPDQATSTPRYVVVVDTTTRPA